MLGWAIFLLLIHQPEIPIPEAAGEFSTWSKVYAADRVGVLTKTGKAHVNSIEDASQVDRISLK